MRRHGNHIRATDKRALGSAGTPYARLIVAAALLVGLTGCGQPSASSVGCREVLTPSSGTKSILVLGDSVSIGYFPHLKSALAGTDVVHNPCNAGSSAYLAAHLDQWLAARPSFAAITFNVGLHDVVLPAELTSAADYEANLRLISEKIKLKTDHAFFVLTTEVPAGSTPVGSDADVVSRNDIARRVMSDEGITVIDAYSVSRHSPDHLSSLDLHYNQTGYEVLADLILSYVTPYAVAVWHRPHWGFRVCSASQNHLRATDNAQTKETV